MLSSWQDKYTCGNEELGASSYLSPRDHTTSAELWNTSLNSTQDGKAHLIRAESSMLLNESYFDSTKLGDIWRHPSHTPEDSIRSSSQEPRKFFLSHGSIPDGSYLLAKESAHSIDDKQHNESIKDEEDMDLTDEDDVLNSTEERVSQQQATAEGIAAKRKMKRFRLNHQQTRFLMSEFVKQPHPDAIHRDRLSQQIPGLSPRQVQVWFQNRRAKMKRLNADDRERVIQMRAVPDNFDNVRALHSPYGSLHSAIRPLTQPEKSHQLFKSINTRLLMIETQRSVTEPQSHMNQKPAIGDSGFTQSSVTTPDALSPLSSASNERYSCNNTSSDPFATGNSVSCSFVGRQHSFDSATSASRPVHALQPLSFRSSLTQPRGEVGHPLPQPIISWKRSLLPSFPNPTLNQGFYEEDHYVAAAAQGYDMQSYSSSAAICSDLRHSPPMRPCVKAAMTSMPLAPVLSDQNRSTTVASPTSAHHTTLQQISIPSRAGNPSNHRHE